MSILLVDPFQINCRSLLDFKFFTLAKYLDTIIQQT